MLTPLHLLRDRRFVSAARETRGCRHVFKYAAFEKEFDCFFCSTDVLTPVLLHSSLSAKQPEETRQIQRSRQVCQPKRNPWYPIIYERRRWKMKMRRIPDIFSGEATKQWVTASLAPLDAAYFLHPPPSLPNSVLILNWPSTWEVIFF